MANTAVSKTGAAKPTLTSVCCRVKIASTEQLLEVRDDLIEGRHQRFPSIETAICRTRNWLVAPQRSITRRTTVRRSQYHLTSPGVGWLPVGTSSVTAALPAASGSFTLHCGPNSLASVALSKHPGGVAFTASGRAAVGGAATPAAAPSGPPMATHRPLSCPVRGGATSARAGEQRDHGHDQPSSPHQMLIGAETPASRQAAFSSDDGRARGRLRRRRRAQRAPCSAIAHTSLQTL